MDTQGLTEFRRYLHAHPEVSTKEFETQNLVEKKLRKLGVEDITKAGHTGLLVHFKGKSKGKLLALRADMDALPIQEENDFEYASENQGVSHKCGHDGHTAIMLGVAAELAKVPPEKGDVLLIFQPAEENGKGAKAILEDPDFSFEPDMIFAFHNLPGYPLHQVVCKKDSFTAAAKSVIFRLKGKTAHAAEPELGINPAFGLAEIIGLAKKLSQPDTTRDDFRLISLIHINLGEKSYGVSAGVGEIHLTLRSWSNQVMDELEQALRQQVEEIAQKEKLTVNEEWLEIFAANDNDHRAFDIIKSSAEDLELDFKERDEPFKWGEDFGLFTTKFKGAMFGVGSGENSPALHNPDYDFPDEIIPTTVKMFLQILKKAQ